MKKLFHLIVLLGLSINGFSQIEKGTLTLGGSIYGNGYLEKSDDLEPDKRLSLGFTPNIGFLLIDNLELRLSPKITYSANSRRVFNDYLDAKGFSTSIGIEGIKYFGTKPLMPFIGLGFHLGQDQNKWEDIYLDENFNQIITHIKTKSLFTQVSIDIGFAYFITESVSINTSIDYSHRISNETLEYDSWDDITSKTKKNSLYFKIGLGIFI